MEGRRLKQPLGLLAAAVHMLLPAIQTLTLELPVIQTPISDIIKLLSQLTLKEGDYPDEPDLVMVTL